MYEEVCGDSLVVSFGNIEAHGINETKGFFRKAQTNIQNLLSGLTLIYLAADKPLDFKIEPEF